MGSSSSVLKLARDLERQETKQKIRHKIVCAFHHHEPSLRITTDLDIHDILEKTKIHCSFRKILVVYGIDDRVFSHYIITFMDQTASLDFEFEYAEA